MKQKRKASINRIYIEFLNFFHSLLTSVADYADDESWEALIAPNSSWQSLKTGLFPIIFFATRAFSTPLLLSRGLILTFNCRQTTVLEK